MNELISKCYNIIYMNESMKATQKNGILQMNGKNNLKVHSNI